MRMEEALLLRIFLDEKERFGNQPLYEAIVMKAREAQLEGATVLRGPLGFGKSKRIHSSKILRLSFDLPVIIEIVDRHEKIHSFLSILEGMIEGGLVTLEKVQAVRFD